MEDIQDLITEKIDIWTSAVENKNGVSRGSSKKVELYGIKKLRELILELAVRGKLVPQDPSDEPASVLLERIAVEKERLIKEKKIKKLPEISESEKPFELPKGWEFCRFGNLPLELYTGLDRGKALQSLSFDYVYFKMNNINNEGGINFDNITKIDASLEEVKKFQLCNGDFLFNTRNSRELVGKTCVFRGYTRTVIFNNNILKAKLSQIVPEYLDYWFRSITGKQILEEKKSNTTNVCAIYQGKLLEFICVIPPLSEQNRIVAKVEELMVLCDQLEEQTEESITAHKTLVETLLATLTNCKNSEELTKNWNRISDHFETLFTTEDSIEQLKQTILELAVMGKLVPQDTNDEPSSVLLKKIAKEKEKLIKEGKIKKQKKLPLINENAKKIDLPKGWSTTRFGDIINLISGQHLKPQEYSESKNEGMLPYLTGPAEFGERFPIPSRFTKMKKAIALPGDILITCKGSGIGKLNESNIEIAISRQLMAIQPILVNNRFVKLIAESLNEHLRSKIVGIAIPGISRSDVTEAIIHLPPLIEQDRIICKIDELMKICDYLKGNYKKEEKILIRFVDTLINNLFNRTPKLLKKKKNDKEMKIKTLLALNKGSSGTVLASIIEREGGKADAKDVWNKSKLSLPEFYKKLKEEIESGHIVKPSEADFEY